MSPADEGNVPRRGRLPRAVVCAFRRMTILMLVHSGIGLTLIPESPANGRSAGRTLLIQRSVDHRTPYRHVAGCGHRRIGLAQCLEDRDRVVGIVAPRRIDASDADALLPSALMLRSRPASTREIRSIRLVFDTGMQLLPG